MNVFNELIVKNAVMNANINSPAVPLVNIFGYAIQAVYTGTPNGVLKLQASADSFPYAQVSPQPPTPQNWTDITGTSQTISSSGIFMWNIDGAYYNYVRLVFTDSSGGTSTAVLNVTVNCKGI